MMTLRSFINGPKRKMLPIAGLTLALIGLTAGNASAAGKVPARLSPLVVQTDNGAVRGMFSGDAREFLGIPYAAPPVGALRWRPPQPAAPWQGVRDATHFGNVCAQNGNIGTGVLNTSTAEDCLYLNVYTPRAPRGQQLPVMVWIHGGGFTGGAASIYDASVLAPKGNAVVVTINYRLNAFGFLALPSLDSENADNSSGDFGLQDQQAALRWVQRNASAFGGNPHNVTIFGESAGGVSVCMNMASPTAAGLFRHAIAESGCVFPAPSKQAAQQQGTALATSLGCADPSTAAACMRAKPVSDILKAETGQSWSPDTGGVTLPLDPQTAFAAGRYNHVPLLNGTNHDEGRFFVALGFDLAGHPITAAQYPALVAGLVGASAAPAVLAHYPLSAFPSPDLAYAQILTDSRFSCPALLADSLAAGSGIYAYEFSDPNPPNDFGITFTFPLGAAHSTELQYVFQKVPVLGTDPPFTPQQLALSNQMIGYWSRFAATGTPNAIFGGASHWPRFILDRQQIQELVPAATAPVSASTFAVAHQCAFWASIEG